MLSKRIVLKRSVVLSIAAIFFTFLYGVVCQAEMMNACVKKNSGDMRLVSNLDQCLSSENHVSWNNVPQIEIEAQKEDLSKAKETIIQLQDQLNALNQTVTQEIGTIQNNVANVETDIQLTSERVATVSNDLLEATEGLASTEEVKAVNDLIIDTDNRIDTLVETAVTIDDIEAATSEVADEMVVIAKNLEDFRTEIDPVIQELDAVNRLINLAKYIEVHDNIVNGYLRPDVIFSGVNVHIQSGSGQTNDGGGALLGLGNLIIGYNEGRENMDGGGVTKRTGSHNLVIGPYHNFESVGGLVAGYYNTVSGAYATVSGGERNTADGYAATVSGGLDSTAIEDYAHIP